MQQAHGGLLVRKGARFDDGTAQHLDQPAPDGIDDDAEEDAGKGVRQKLRQKRKPCQPHGGADLRRHRAPAVPDPVREPGAQHVHDELGHKEGPRDQRDPPQGYPVVPMELQKQQRGKVRGDGLGDQPQITGSQGLPVVLIHIDFHLES